MCSLYTIEEMRRSVKAIAKRRMDIPKHSDITVYMDDSKCITRDFTEQYGAGWQCVTSASDIKCAMTRDHYYFWVGSWWSGFVYVLLYYL